MLGGLGVWRFAHLLVAEDGPAGVVRRLRFWLQRRSLGAVLECLDCVSLWLAIPVALALGNGWMERALLWPALSAGAILIDRVVTRLEAPPPVYVEDERETDDGLLRKERQIAGITAGTGSAGPDHESGSRPS